MRIRAYLLMTLVILAASSCKKDKEDFFPGELEEVKTALVASFDSLHVSMAAVVAEFAQQGGIDTSLMRVRLAGLYQQASFSKNFNFITPEGVLLLIEPPVYYPSQGIDISMQSHIIETFSTKQPVLSGVIPVVEGFPAAVDIYPVVDGSRVLGAISTVMDPSDILGRTILPVVKGQPFEMWVMQKDGLVIYDQDAAEIGLNILTDPLYASFPSLLAATQLIAGTPTGSTTYSFYQTSTQKVVTKKTYWVTMLIHNTEWKIVWVIPE